MKKYLLYISICDRPFVLGLQTSFFSSVKKEKTRGTWWLSPLSIGLLISPPGHDLRVVRWSSASGSLLSGESVSSPSHSPCLCSHVLSLSVKLINKILKKRKEKKFILIDNSGWQTVPLTDWLIKTVGGFACP